MAGATFFFFAFFNLGVPGTGPESCFLCLITFSFLTEPGRTGFSSGLILRGEEDLEVDLDPALLLAPVLDPGRLTFLEDPGRIRFTVGWRSTDLLPEREDAEDCLFNLTEVD